VSFNKSLETFGTHRVLLVLQR